MRCWNINRLAYVKIQKKTFESLNFAENNNKRTFLYSSLPLIYRSYISKPPMTVLNQYIPWFSLYMDTYDKV